ncbi:MAG TPA: GGDEF domain-containing protein [Pseudomonadales bacterium]|nr:GGDEF domain-containing protein [Pseudomonadales bacterium]
MIEQTAFSTAMLVSWAAAASLLLAAALASLFHRGRSALAALVLLWVWSGFAVATEVLSFEALPALRLEAMLLFAPLDLLIVSLFVETALLSWRGALIVVLLGLQTLLAVLLPMDAWDAIWRLERWPARAFGELFTTRGWPSPGLSACLGAVAALLAALRWWFVRDPVLLGIAFAAAVSGSIGYGMLVSVAPALPLLAAGVVLLASVGWASYRMAFLDPLTGLPGRRLLDEHMARLGRRWAVAMVDVDHFKKFNDNHGHDVGDQVLRMVAATLRRHFGRHAYRYGGEEFTILFPGRSAGQARERCEAVRADIAQRQLMLRGKDRPEGKAPRKARKGAAGADGKAGKASKKAVAPAQRGLGVTVSIGIAERSAQMRRPEVLIKAADVALYRAKQGGRDRVVEHG